MGVDREGQAELMRGVRKAASIQGRASARRGRGKRARLGFMLTRRHQPKRVGRKERKGRSEGKVRCSSSGPGGWEQRESTGGQSQKRQNPSCFWQLPWLLPPVLCLAMGLERDPQLLSTHSKPQSSSHCTEKETEAQRS